MNVPLGDCVRVAIEVVHERRAIRMACGCASIECEFAYDGGHDCD